MDNSSGDSSSPRSEVDQEKKTAITLSGLGYGPRDPPGGGPEYEYGCRWFKPACLQRFNTPKWLLFFLSICSCYQGILMNGLIPVSVTSIQRRFGLSSADMSTVINMYDIGYAVGILPIAYFGGRHESLCDRLDLSEDRKNAFYFFLFCAAQFVNGLACCPLYTMGYTYLDENIPQRSSGLYLGVYIAMSVVGAGFGFTAGGKFLDLYGDMLKGVTSPVPPGDFRFYGAWWLGFVLFGSLTILAGLPLVFYPKELPQARAYRLVDRNQAHERSVKRDSGPGPEDYAMCAPQTLFDMFQTAKRILGNPTFDFIVAQMTIETGLLTCMTNYLPKILENLFALTPSMASIATGGVVIPACAIGNVLGGWLIKRWDMVCRSMLMFSAGFNIIGLAIAPSLLLSCSRRGFAGITVAYEPNVSLPTAALNTTHLTAACNRDCSCGDTFEPAFTNCSCLFAGQSAPLTPGFCKDEKCTWQLPLFLALLFGMIFCLFVTTMPVQQAQLRCVDFADRTIAVGIGWVFMRLVGAVPFLFVFGELIDQYCHLWQVSCDADLHLPTERKACSFYDIQQMARSNLILVAACKTSCAVALCLAVLTYRPRKEVPPVTDMTQAKSAEHSDELAQIDSPEYKGQEKVSSEDSGE